MRVIIPDKVFGEDDVDPPELLDLVTFAYEGRHRVVVEPLIIEEIDESEHPNLSSWLAELSGDLEEDIVTAIRRGTDEALSDNRSKDEIEVVPGAQSNWDSDPPRLTVSDAQRFLGYSLHLLVENSVNDAAFLKTMFRRLLGTEYSEPLEKAFEQKWARFEHGGGLGDMKNRVEKLEERPIERSRTWVMFDSDAPEPGRPSDDSEALREACENCALDHHQLRRRAMENYLPRKALHSGANVRTENSVTVDRRAAEAYSEMTREQRHHYHMKSGFSEDQVDEPPELFEDVDLQNRRRLQGGFGSDIGDLFEERNFPLQTSWFRDEYSGEDEAEFEKMYDQIYRKL
jgi:hypothetical protein